MNIIKKVIVCLTVFIIPTLLCSNLHAKWQTISSEKGKFTISMPGKPQFKESIDKTVVGQICENTYSYKTKNMTLTVEFQDLPGIALIFGGNMVYNKSAKAFLKNVNGKKIYYKKFKENELIGKELYYETPTRLGWVRFALVRNRLFVLQASFTKGVKGASIKNRYYKSFRPKEPHKKIKSNKFHDGL